MSDYAPLKYLLADFIHAKLDVQEAIRDAELAEKDVLEHSEFDSTKDYHIQVHGLSSDDMMDFTVYADKDGKLWCMPGIFVKGGRDD